MSIMMCENCDRDVDTDFEEMFYLDDMKVCENCYDNAQFEGDLTSSQEDFILEQAREINSD